MFGDNEKEVWDTAVGEIAERLSENGKPVTREDVEENISEMISKTSDCIRPKNARAIGLFISGSVIKETTEFGDFQTCDLLSKDVFRLPEDPKDIVSEFERFFNELRFRTRAEDREVAIVKLGLMWGNGRVVFHEDGIPVGKEWGNDIKDDVFTLASFLMGKMVAELGEKAMASNADNDVIGWLIGCSVALTVRSMPDSMLAKCTKGESE